MGKAGHLDHVDRSQIESIVTNMLLDKGYQRQFGLNRRLRAIIIIGRISRLRLICATFLYVFTIIYIDAKIFA